MLMLSRPLASNGATTGAISAPAGAAQPGAKPSALVDLLQRLLEAPADASDDDFALRAAALAVLRALSAAGAAFADALQPLSERKEFWAALLRTFVEPVVAAAGAATDVGGASSSLALAVPVEAVRAAGGALHALAAQLSLAAVAAAPERAAPLFEAAATLLKPDGGRGPAILQWTEAVQAEPLGLARLSSLLVGQLVAGMAAAGVSMGKRTPPAAALQLVQPLTDHALAASDAGPAVPGPDYVLSRVLLAQWLGTGPAPAPSASDMAVDNGSSASPAAAAAAAAAARLLAELNWRLAYDDACSALVDGVRALVQAMAGLGTLKAAGGSGPLATLRSGRLVAAGAAAEASPLITLAVARVVAKRLRLVLAVRDQERRRIAAAAATADAGAEGPPQPSALASATAVALARLLAAAVFGGSTGAAAAATWEDKDRCAILDLVLPLVTVPASAGLVVVIPLGGDACVDPVYDLVLRATLALLNALHPADGGLAATAPATAATLAQAAAPILELSASLLGQIDWAAPGAGAADEANGTTPLTLLAVLRQLWRPGFLGGGPAAAVVATQWDPSSAGAVAAWIDAVHGALRQALPRLAESARARRYVRALLATLLALGAARPSFAARALARGVVFTLCTGSDFAAVLARLAAGSSAGGAAPGVDVHAYAELLALALDAVRLLALCSAAAVASGDATDASGHRHHHQPLRLALELLLQLDETVVPSVPPAAASTVLDLLMRAYPQVTAATTAPAAEDSSGSHLRASDRAAKSSAAATAAEYSTLLAVELLRLHELVLRGWLTTDGPLELVRAAGTVPGGPANTATGRWVRRFVHRLQQWLPALALRWPRRPLTAQLASATRGATATASDGAALWLEAVTLALQSALLLTRASLLPGDAGRASGRPRLPAWLPTIAFVATTAAPKVGEASPGYGTLVALMTAVAAFAQRLAQPTDKAVDVAPSLAAACGALELLAMLASVHLVDYLQQAAAADSAGPAFGVADPRMPRYGTSAAAQARDAVLQILADLVSEVEQLSGRY